MPYPTGAFKPSSLNANQFKGGMSSMGGSVTPMRGGMSSMSRPVTPVRGGMSSVGKITPQRGGIFPMGGGFGR